VITLAVFGQPVVHSLSPRIHLAFGQQAGLSVAYRAIEVAPGGLAEALDALAARGGVGCNVTLPLKHEARALARSCSDHVELAQAANTLLRDGAGWHAENTDGTGLIRDLRRNGLDPTGKRVALLGAGGAAAGVCAALLDAGPSELRIYNRTVDRALALAERHRPLGPVSADSMDRLGEESFDLVLNATALGHRGDMPPVSVDLFTPGGALYDLNYGRAAEPLENWAQQAGVTYRSGLGMLVGQAAESFRLWTGFEPALEPVLAELRRSVDR
jgi:shikimate dehydrogenase